jgi:hypothetical protein
MAKKTKKLVSKRIKPVVAPKAPKAPKATRKPYTKAVKPVEAPVEAPVVVVTTEPAVQTLLQVEPTDKPLNITWNYPVEYTKVSKDEPLVDEVLNYSTSVISKVKSFFNKSDYITAIRDAAFAHPLIFGVLFAVALFAFSALVYAVIGLY